MSALRISGTTPEHSLYERVGGMAFFRQLVANFYDGVEVRPVLRAMYDEDLTSAKEHLALFFAQYFGGPETYNETRGHPRLRLRHAPYVIDVNARDLWLEAMLLAIEGSGASQEDRAELTAYVDVAANSLRNA